MLLTRRSDNVIMKCKVCNVYTLKKKKTETIPMEDNVYELSLGRMFNAVLRGWWIVLLAIILGASLAFGFTTYFATPMYTSTATISVSGNVTSYQQAVLGETFAKDGEEIITSSSTLRMAADKLNDPDNIYYTPETETAKSLLPMITTKVTTGTRFFDFSITCEDPERAQLISSAIVESFCELLAEGDIIEDGRGVVIGLPSLPESPSSPNKASNMFIGILIGLILSAGTLIVIELMNDAIDGEDWLVSVYGERIPLLSVIPDVSETGYGYKKYYKYKDYAPSK